MKKKMFLGKARYLPRMYVVIVLCSIIWLGGSGKGGGGKSGGNPNTCDQSDRDAQLKLVFPLAQDVPGRFASNPYCSIPVVGSNPSVDFGANSLSSASPYQYYCKVIVKGQCGGYTKTYVWTKPGLWLDIKVPTRMPYSVIVDFYEACTRNCNSLSNSRAQFSREVQLNSYQSIINAELVHIWNEPCF